LPPVDSHFSVNSTFEFERPDRTELPFLVIEDDNDEREPSDHRADFVRREHLQVVAVRLADT
jgi:hypothetical protein